MICPKCGGSGTIAVTCVECQKELQPNWFIYEAHHKTTGEIVKPICGPCIRGDILSSKRFNDGTWTHVGPLNQ